MMNSKNNHKQNQRALHLCNALFKNKNIRLILFIIIGIAAIITFLFSHSPYKFIVIEDIKNDKILWKAEFETDEWFYHQYIHSVEKSMVIEKFRADEFGQIFTMESWTKSFGAGLPYEFQGNVERMDGFYVMKDLNRLVHGGELNMHPSDLLPHTFHYKHYEILLSEPPYARNNIRISIKPANWFKKI